MRVKYCRFCETNYDVANGKPCKGCDERPCTLKHRWANRLLWRWVPGRRKTGYLVLKLLEFWRVDLHLLKFPEESHIPPHRDPVAPGLRHHRVNLTLRRARVGGRPVVEGDERGRIYHMRPDIQVHRVTTVALGTRWVLSLGWVTGKREDDNEDTER